MNSTSKAGLSGHPPLPPGQREATGFHRFGLPWLALRYPYETSRVTARIGGEVAVPLELEDHWAQLPRSSQVSDFHCVTTWSVRGQHWGGVRFRDFYEQLVVPVACPGTQATLVVFIGQDGYRNALPLRWLLADDVLLADEIDSAPLPVEHGAPLRLVAPAHYGYKNVKHICAIEFHRDARRHHRIPGPIFMSHPLGRVAFEERGRGLPGAAYRAIYRPLIPMTVRAFRSGTRLHRRRAANVAGERDRRTH